MGNLLGSSAPVNLNDHVIYHPGAGDDRKHSFDPHFFQSDKCKAMTRVYVDDSVEMKADGGQHLLFAKTNIKKGTIVEKSVLRQCDGLPEGVPNPFIIRSGTDFTIAGVDLPAETPYLAAGSIMFYSTTGDINVELKINVSDRKVEGPAGTQSLEVDVVATVDIEAGAKLVRKGADIPVDVKYGDVYDMSEDDLNAWMVMWAANDLEDAQKANKEQEDLHEETIREHFKLSREGKIPLFDTSKARVLPHPVWPGYGVFATVPIKKGEIVEYGLHRKIEGLNGDKCPYVFTWNSNGKRRTQAEGPNQWGQGAGNIMFYNSDSPANCRLFRLYGGWRFILVARKDIAVGEEMMHLYKSSSWRKCFVQDDYLPKEQPLEARSRTASEAGSKQGTPGLGPQPEPDILLNDGQWVRSSPALEPEKDPAGPADDLKLDAEPAKA